MATISKDQKSAWKARESKRAEELRLAKARGFGAAAKPRDSVEDAVSFLDHVDKLIAAAFSAQGEKVLFADEAVELKRAGERLRPAFEELMRVFVEPLRKSKPSVADYGREKLISLMMDAFIVGSRGTLSQSAEKLAEMEKLRRSRTEKAKKASSRHAEGLRILEDELAKGARRWKVFAPQVNARLLGAGLTEVSEKTMRLWKKELYSHIT